MPIYKMKNPIELKCKCQVPIGSIHVKPLKERKCLILEYGYVTWKLAISWVVPRKPLCGIGCGVYFFLKAVFFLITGIILCKCCSCDGNLIITYQAPFFCLAHRKAWIIYVVFPLRGWSWFKRFCHSPWCSQTAAQVCESQCPCKYCLYLLLRTM